MHNLSRDILGMRAANIVNIIAHLPFQIPGRKARERRPIASPTALPVNSVTKTANDKKFLAGDRFVWAVECFSKSSGAETKNGQRAETCRYLDMFPQLLIVSVPCPETAQSKRCRTASSLQNQRISSTSGSAKNSASVTVNT